MGLGYTELKRINKQKQMFDSNYWIEMLNMCLTVSLTVSLMWVPSSPLRSGDTEWDVSAESFCWVIEIQHVAEVNKSLHAWEQSNNVSHIFQKSFRNSAFCFWVPMMPYFLRALMRRAYDDLRVTFMQSVEATQEEQRSGLDWPSEWLRGRFSVPTQQHELPLLSH